MPARRPSRRTRERGTAAAVALGSATLLLSGLAPAATAAPAATDAPAATAAPALDAGAGGPGRGAPVSSGLPAGATDRGAFYDSRQDPQQREELARRAAADATAPPAGLVALRQELGVQGSVTIDPLTATPRSVSRLDGFLTGPSAAAAQTVALDYVRNRPDVFRLDAADLATLRLRRDYVDIEGVHHLSWQQFAGDVPVFGNGLKANVAKDGSLVSVQGSPVRGLGTVAAAPGLDAAAARAAATRDAAGTVPDAAVTGSTGSRRATTFSNGDRAELVVFQTLGGPRLAWETTTAPRAGQLFSSVVDAATGRVLYRRDLVQSENAKVWEYYPGAARGGTQKVVDLTAKGWLADGARRLAGNTSHTFSDVNDDDVAQASEEVRPVDGDFSFDFRTFNRIDGAPCSPSYQCSWNSDQRRSWQVDRAQDATQVFYFLGRFHDHLAAAPIGFTRAAGNFEAVDGDAVQANADDGAAVADGLPDGSHVDNANMATPRDGIAPRMQMYLFHQPGQAADPFLEANGGDSGDIVYHEYTHGLSNRLVVDAAGNSTLGAVQAGAMGEAWSDWYAMDFLTNLGVQPDTAAPGEVLVGKYVSLGKDDIRSEPLDCPVGSASKACTGALQGDGGGYTYGDFGKIAGGPEVHADGEIWAQTLWDLRGAVGVRTAQSLVTRAMELAPANPSFLDMRNAILQADTTVNGGRARAGIWRTFAHRGMGYFAGAVDGDDAAPAEDFSLPPAPGTPRGSLTGTVTDAGTGRAVRGAVVAFGGHASGFPGDYADRTDADGHYTISRIVAGTYPKVSAGGAGYDREVRAVSVSSDRNVLDWRLRRDWAALSGGGRVTASNDRTGDPYGCGPDAMIDQSQGQGWSAERTLSGGKVVGKYVTIALPRAVDVAQVAIDPTGTCGDAGSASTGPYLLETSRDGSTWTRASAGTFTPQDRDRFNTPALAAASTRGVRYVRYTMRDSQVLQVGSCPGAFSGCDFVDSRELEVYGVPAGS